MANIYYVDNFIRNERICNEIKHITGMDISTLRDLFAAGWKLTPPEGHETVKELEVCPK